MRISDWSSDVCSSDLRAMGEALDATEGKALIFCRTGMRSTTLWALAQADRKPVAHLLGAADAAGYDLALHEEWLKARQSMARSRDRKSTRLNSSHQCETRIQFSALKKKSLNTNNNTKYIVIYLNVNN